MKYTARVTQVLQQVQKQAAIINGELKTVADLPRPDYVEIEAAGGGYSFYRFTDAGEFCGDTWHEHLWEAFDQARYEYGLTEKNFAVTPAPGAGDAA